MSGIDGMPEIAVAQGRSGTPAACAEDGRPRTRQPSSAMFPDAFWLSTPTDPAQSSMDSIAMRHLRQYCCNCHRIRMGMATKFETHCQELFKKKLGINRRWKKATAQAVGISRATLYRYFADD